MNNQSGSYKEARGCLNWQPGDEPAEISIRRYRDSLPNMEDVLARLAALEREVTALKARLDESDTDGK